jgi:hypothetical protein
MSHEQVLSRSSAATMPGAPLAGIRVMVASTATHQTNPATETAVNQPNRGPSTHASSAQTSAETATRNSITPTPPTGNTEPTVAGGPVLPDVPGRSATGQGRAT